MRVDLHNGRKTVVVVVVYCLFTMFLIVAYWPLSVKWCPFIVAKVNASLFQFFFRKFVVNSS